MDSPRSDTANPKIIEGATPGKEELEQRRERLPPTPGHEELGQRREQLPPTPGRPNNGRHSPPETAAIIYPCPFSKNYGIPAQQAWQLLNIFLVYRLMLACMFIILFYSHLGPSLLGSHDKALFSYSSLSYLILTIISGIGISQRLTGYTLQAQVLIFTDIILITLIMHACGGISSGLGILLAVSIASGGLLIGGRCAMLFAAIASLAVLSEQIYAVQAHCFKSTSFTYAGMLGGSFFTIALLSHVLAQRTEQTALLANQRQQTIDQLQELNQYIIQHLQSGIIISDKNQKILMSNGAAMRLAHLDAMPDSLAQISNSLTHAFTLWLHDPSQDFALLQIPNQASGRSENTAGNDAGKEDEGESRDEFLGSPATEPGIALAPASMQSAATAPGVALAPASMQSEIQIRFMQLPTRREIFHMIILEDVSAYKQRLQQSKLASLGQLTASIAHEIRNPLGAISHAGQLLSENPELSKEDKRLTEIIQQHSLRMNQIIEDILQLSRRSASVRKKINLASWLNEYLQSFILENSLDPASFQKIIDPEPLYVLADPGHLKQIFDNLCKNALKYGHPERSPIIVSMKKLDQTPCIEIIDAGPGISPAIQSRLFEPFFTTSPNGTGLGLYISRELAELNQAKLSYHIIETGKSCFRLCLPDAEQTIIEI